MKPTGSLTCQAGWHGHMILEDAILDTAERRLGGWFAGDENAPDGSADQTLDPLRAVVSWT
ncbi:hypothetical protein SAMN05445060_0895 [Williamsia sterculiae]|uniref:Uncharacterized protein n=2 Tax=Williamsia sterculiae TaxID=1344003 RepID=A0A1N7DTJ8_9NOCA|nr:hypothetical protein SAMN05445060_0895 [Williamsia sterculiae]